MFASAEINVKKDNFLDSSPFFFHNSSCSFKTLSWLFGGSETQSNICHNARDPGFRKQSWQLLHLSLCCESTASRSQAGQAEIEPERNGEVYSKIKIHTMLLPTVHCHLAFVLIMQRHQVCIICAIVPIKTLNYCISHMLCFSSSLC